MRPSTRILGIDPGFRITGYGILDTSGQQSQHVASGFIKASQADSVAGRLAIIFREVSKLVETHRPDELSIERVFVHKNVDSALKLGHARSAAICATFEHEIPVFEYAARQVKQAVVGKGSASKEQVQHMVRVLLSIDGVLQMDASDALGIALCHAHSRTLSQQYAELMP
jgi:crossover junction endodeoxyribonuclease RuvC